MKISTHLINLTLLIALMTGCNSASPIIDMDASDAALTDVSADRTFNDSDRVDTATPDGATPDSNNSDGGDGSTQTFEQAVNALLTSSDSNLAAFCECNWREEGFASEPDCVAQNGRTLPGWSAAAGTCIRNNLTDSDGLQSDLECLTAALNAEVACRENAASCTAANECFLDGSACSRGAVAFEAALSTPAVTNCIVGSGTAGVCSDAVPSVTTVGNGVFTANLIGAGSNQGPFSCTFDPEGPPPTRATADVVFRFTAPAAGPYRIDTNGSDFDTTLSVRSSCDPASELACSDDEGVANRSSVLLNLTSGQQVFVAVQGFFTTSAGMVRVNINALPAFTNLNEFFAGLTANVTEQCRCNAPNATAACIAENDLTDRVRQCLTDGLEDLEPEFLSGLQCASDSAIEPNTSCRAAATTCDASALTACDAPVASSFTSCGEPNLAEWYGSAATCVCNGAPKTTVVGTGMVYSGAFAPDDVGTFLAPQDLNCEGAAPMYFTWTAPSSGQFTISTAGSSVGEPAEAADTVLSVWSGCNAEAEIVCNDDIDVANGVSESSVSLSAASGTTYLIAVAAFNDLSTIDNLVLTVTPVE